MPSKPMTPEQYRKMRERIGTQAEAAELLGVHPQTMSDRERGVERITTEASHAIRWVAQGGEAAPKKRMNRGAKRGGEK